jgi:hypothetical protein
MTALEYAAFSTVDVLNPSARISALRKQSRLSVRWYREL